METTLPQLLSDQDLSETPPPESFSHQARALSRVLTWLFWSGDLDEASSFLRPDLRFACPYQRRATTSAPETLALLAGLRSHLSRSMVLHDEAYDASQLADEVFLVTASYSVEERPEPGPGIRVEPHGRLVSVICTFVWTLEQEATPKLAACSCVTMPPEGELTVGAAASNTAARHERINRWPTAAPRQTPPDDAIYLQARDTQGTTHWVTSGSVVYVAAAHQYVDVFCTDRRIRLRSTLESVLEQLGDVVMRVHRSYAVNPAFVSHLDGHTLHLTTGASVPIPIKRIHATRVLLSERCGQVGGRG